MDGIYINVKELRDMFAEMETEKVGTFTDAVSEWIECLPAYADVQVRIGGKLVMATRLPLDWKGE